MNIVMKRPLLFIGVCLFFFVVSASDAAAAYLYIDPAEPSIFRGDTVTLSVRVDTDEAADECVNAIDATITYSDNIRAVDVSRGESIMNVWVEEPVINEEENTITFAGGIPGGYCGRIAGDPQLTNVIAELVFRSPGFNVGGGNAPIANVDFADTTRVLLHDGLGTPAELTYTGAMITLRDSAGSSIEDDWADRVGEDDAPPADFAITLAEDDSAFSGRSYIVFNTVDKQSGIDHYEVMEEPFEEFYLFRWGAADAPWIRTQSPYVLKDQTLNSTIRVKAVDKAGNETVAVLVPDEALRTFTVGQWLFVAISAIFGLLIIGGVGYVIWRRKSEFDELYEDENNEYERDER